MSNVYFISDLHFGHEKIVYFGRKFAGDLSPFRTGETWQENIHHIIRQWNSVIRKRDTIWVLGDIAFNQEGYDALFELKGDLKLVRGNHDNYFSTEQWLKRFSTVESLVKYKEFWLSHAPIHPDELRGRKNIHGHVHNQSIRNGYTGEYDPRYINVCCEAIGEKPVSLHQLRDGTYDRIRRC